MSLDSDRARLLGELMAEMMAMDGLRIPDEAWYQFQQMAALPYTEVVVPRWNAGEWEFLLVRRPSDDPHWQGDPWNIPGSLWRPWRWSSRDPSDRVKIPITMAQACDITARQDGFGPVELVKEVGTHFWTDHPYGWPISHICLCRAAGPVEEAEDRKYFPLRNLPKMVSPHHVEFLVRVQDELVRADNALDHMLRS